jgi:N-terminal domain of galactosyltransferase
MINNQRLSITTGSLDRLEPLKRSLATWLDSPVPDEIVIVDWGNEIPLHESLRMFEDSRIVIARAEDQRYWLNSKCHNLELQLASGEQLLRLDNDYLLKPTFFERHLLKEGCFFCGNWKTVPVEMDDKRNLAGALYAHVSDVLAINGYNERLIHYGCDDDDLYDRLAEGGLRRLDMDLSTLDHIPHSDNRRYARLEIAPKLPRPMSGTPQQVRDKIDSRIKYNLTQMSKAIASSSPWTTNDRMSRWHMKEISPRRLLCREIAKNDSPHQLTYIEAVSEREMGISMPSSPRKA